MTGQTGHTASSGILRDTARIKARAAMDAALADDPVYDDLQIGEILRALPDRTVARGWWAGEGVILKQFLRADGPAIVASLTGELTALAPHMSTGRAQVNRLLASVPHAGLVVLTEVPGQKMSLVLPQADPAERTRILRDAGGFALAYGTGRRKMDKIGIPFWIKKLDRMAATTLPPVDQPLLAALVASLRAQAIPLKGAPLCRTAVHGDFVPVNLHVDDDGVYGYDTQGEANLPLSVELARFLAWLAMEDEAPQAPLWLGLSDADRRDFLIDGLPAPEEDPRLLPFFLGFELAGRFLERHRDGARAPAARRALRHYIDDVPNHL